ncbi:uncharacterized protein LOC116945077 isoform X1 [Petromyzon marinus]|uniref:uncharacterized protein LOC116945077 isoform X1 n=1 Tax=Petromyzon marinus TaxID=7757 RepID=UPI003F72A5FD
MSKEVQPPGPLAAYNSLEDKHLAAYFSSSRMRRHLRMVGLIKRSGELVSERAYKLQVARKEHQERVREVLAQAILDKALHMEHYRQAAIRRKLEEISKLKRIRRIQVGCVEYSRGAVPPSWTARGQQAERDALQILQPHPPPERRTGPRSGGTSNGASPDSPAATSSAEAEESSRPLTAPERSSRPQRQQPLRTAVSLPCPTRLNQLEREMLQKLTGRTTFLVEPHPPPSPYVLPLIYNRVAATGSNHHHHHQQQLNSRSNEALRSRTSAQPLGTRRGRVLRISASQGHASPPAVGDGKVGSGSQPRLRTLVPRPPQPRGGAATAAAAEVSMLYLGKRGRPSRDQVLGDEVRVMQQHCGGESLCVFHGRLRRGEAFRFRSRRLGGFPFSLSLYVDGLLVGRLSWCCEFRHWQGGRLSGRLSHFSLTGVQGAAPCYRCIIAQGLDIQPFPPAKRKGGDREQAARTEPPRRESVEQPQQQHSSTEESDEEEEDEDVDVDDDDDDGDGDRDEAAASSGKTAPNEYMEDFEEEEEELEEEMEERQQKVKEEDTGEVVEKCPGSGGEGGVVETDDEPRGFDDGAGEVTEESDCGSDVEGGSATVGSANRETNVRSSPAHSSENVGEDEEEADEKRNNEEESDEEKQGEIPDDDWDRETPSPLCSYMEEEERDDEGDVTTRGGSSHSARSEENVGREGRGTVASDEESGHGSDATEVDAAAGQDEEEEWDEAIGDGDGSIPAAAAVVVGDDASSGALTSVARRISAALSHTERRAASEPELSSDSSNSEDEDSAVTPVAAILDSGGSHNDAIGPDGKTDAEADDNVEESGDHEAAVKDSDAEDVASEWEAETSARGREVATVATEDDSPATKGMKNDDNQGANDVTNEGEVSQRTPGDEREALVETSDVMDAGGLGVTDADLKEDTKAQDGAPAEAEDRAPSQEAQVQDGGPEGKAEVENNFLDEAEAQDGAVVEEAEAQDGAAVEKAEAQDRAAEEAEAQDGAAVEEAEAQDRAAVEEAEVQDGAVVEEAEAQDGAAVEETEAQDGAAVEEAEAQDGAVVEEAEAQDGAVVEEAEAQDGAPVEEAEAQDGAAVGEAEAQDGDAVEEADAQGGAPIEEAEAQDGALGEEADTQDGAPTEASEAQSGPPTEETETHDKARVEEAKAKHGVPTDTFEVQDGAPTEEAEAQSGAPSAEAEDKDRASSKKAEAQDRASSEEAEAQDGAPVEEAEVRDGAPSDEIKSQSGVETEETEVQCEAPSAEVEAQDETSAEKHENTISDKAMDGDIKHEAHGVQWPGEEAPQADNGFQDKDPIEAVANIENGVTGKAHAEDLVAAQEDENKVEGEAAGCATDTLFQQQQEGLNSVQDSADEHVEALELADEINTDESPAEVGLDTHDESPCNGPGDHEGTAEQEQREDQNPETEPNSEELERDEKKPPKLWKKLSQRVLSFNEHQNGEAAMDERGDQKPDPDKQAKVQGDVDTKEIEVAAEKVESAQDKTPADKSGDVLRGIVRNEAAEENTEPGDARPDDGDHARADEESDGCVVKSEVSQQAAEAQQNDLGDAVEPGDTLQADENTDVRGASRTGPSDNDVGDAGPEDGTKRSSGSTAEDLDGQGRPRNEVGDGREGGTEKSNAASGNGQGDGEADGNKKPRLWKQLSKRVLSWSEQQNESSPTEEAEMGGKREEGPHGGAETHGGADNHGGELQCGVSTEEAVVHQGSCREREQRSREEAGRGGDVKAPTGDTETGEDETLSGEAGDSNGGNLDLVASDDKPAESEDNPATEQKLRGGLTRCTSGCEIICSCRTGKDE